MEKINKYFLILIIFIFLIIPIIFGFNIEYLFIREFDLFNALILFLGFILFIIIGKLIEMYVYNEKNITVLEKQDVINAFISRRNQIIIWVFFPIIMIIEELIFRFYIIGLLINQLESDTFTAIFISSLIFSLFHIHTWFSYKNLRVLLVNLVFPFFLGLFNGYIFLTLGIFPCIIIHYIIVLNLYYNLYNRYFRNST